MNAPKGYDLDAKRGATGALVAKWAAGGVKKWSVVRVDGDGDEAMSISRDEVERFIKHGPRLPAAVDICASESDPESGAGTDVE